jgi:hypothetical protein
MDTNDNPHISYFDASDVDLKYATFNGSTWQIETVDSAGGVGRYTSIALDAKGHPRIAYLNFTDHNLKYAYAY